VHEMAGRLAVHARMTDQRGAQFLAALLRGEFFLKLKFLREGAKGNWVVKDKCPVRAERTN